MLERGYDNILAILGKLPFPEYVFVKGKKKIGFTGNHFAELVEKIFTDYSFQRGKGLPCQHRSSWIPENYFKYTNGFTEKEKSILFIVLFNKLINEENPPRKVNADFVKLIRSVFGITETKFRSIYKFFNANLPYQDNKDCIYFSGSKENKLIMAGGLNIVFSLNNQNEVIYFKNTGLLDVFLSKSYLTNRIYNSMSSDVIVTGMCIYAGEKVKVGKECFGHSELLHLLQKNALFKTINIEQKEFLPRILLSAEENKIVISGRSTPLSPISYLEPILEWLNLYRQFGGKQLNIQINLEYYNTYTYKFLLRLLDACKALERDGKRVIITWYYSPDDDEMLESGNQMKSYYNGNFLCLPVNDRVRVLV